MTCLKCNGTGKCKDELTGIEIVCDCQIGGKEDVKARALEYLKHRNDESQGTVEFKEGDNKSAYAFGVVPEWRKDDMFSPEYLKQAIKERYRYDSLPVVGVQRYIKTLTDLFLDIQTEKRISSSYLISAHSGYGKETFANTCLKELYRQGKNVVPYVSLMDIYRLMNAENLLLRLNKAHLTENGNRTDTDEYLSESRIDWKIKDRVGKIFESDEINKLVARYSKFDFGYEDFIRSDVLFTRITESFLQCYELPMLSYILRERSRLGKATVVFTDKSLSSYIKESGMESAWENIIARTKYDERALDKLNYIPCYRESKKGAEIMRTKMRGVEDE